MWHENICDSSMVQNCITIRKTVRYFEVHGNGMIWAQFKELFMKRY